MKAAHATTTKSERATQDVTTTLDDEARELETLHLGLRRHLCAWRDAHETAILRLGAVMARIDAMVERLERDRP
jgi:hypothetical protein